MSIGGVASPPSSSVVIVFDISICLSTYLANKLMAEEGNDQVDKY
jgi:hypothetical protein